MSASKWTPGPWTVSVSGGDRYIDSCDGWIAEVNCWPTSPIKLVPRGSEKHIANARLIAAAPDLYEALWAILYADQENAVPDEIHAKARAALDKAKGEPQ